MKLASLYKKKLFIILEIIFVFAISFLMMRYLISAVKLGSISEPFVSPATSFTSTDTTPSYDLRIPIAYDLEGQPVTTYGDLNTLTQENYVMYFSQDFTGTSSGSTYVIYTISTADFTVNENYTLTLNWEVHGFGDIMGYTIETQIVVYILYQDIEWISIYTVSTPDDRIDRSYGWNEFIIPKPYEDYINGNEIKIKIELSQLLTESRSWTQRLYMRWLLLEIQKDVSLNCIKASEITVISEGFESSGNISGVHEEDGDCFILSRVTPPSGETRHIQFSISFDLGHYGTEPLLGFRFSHFDYLTRLIEDSAITYTGNIYVVGESSNTFLCYIRRMLDNYIIPDDQNATFPILGDWNIEGKIQLLYDIEYTVFESLTILANVDWASLQIIRGPNPIVVSELLNSTIYAQQDVWLNITCLDGKAPITEIRLAPWDDLIGTTAGSYLYSQYVEIAGEISLSITINDEDEEEYIIPLGSIIAIHRPISIVPYLSENPFSQEFIIQLYIKDILSNEPLGLYPFTKTILKNGSWFRQQNHQTDPTGTFTIHENVQDYLDWNYTIIIETPESSTHEATSVFAYIILSECPPYLFIDNISYSTPLKANDQIILFYTVMCQTELDSLILYKNSTLFQTLPTELGSHNFTFQDVGGCWKYYLYANNSREFQSYSSPFILNITPLKTHLLLNSALDTENHAIILEIQLLDEFNRSCVNVPLQITIYDFGEIFYYHEVATGMEGTYIYVHFNQYLDHSFTLTITSQATPFYSGAILTEGGLSYEGYPLYTIIGIGLTVGIVSVVLSIIKRKIRS